MALRKVHIEKIAKKLAAQFKASNATLASEDAVFGRIASLLTSNMEAERALEDEAHKLLDKNRRTIGGDIDEQKAFMMIKKQLAKQKNFTL
ncbi:MAG: DUF507 family protein [Deltaproteobacteria bacterium]|nr:DUF507 family protein [Deltaproteobacteria bacterium]MBI2342117.1 DUF507 family protein [Deltaproteobacteria bacterium]MBI2974670.1 DUF507 family protein [Deltaproteobacteria bacterium]